ncbi:cardiolipin synthase [Bacillus sp. V3B]|nr:cardiolipin synthase [Bacillus sp. V3B]
MSTIFVLFVLFILLLFVDYSLGRKTHLKSLKRKSYSFRSSNIEVFTTGPELFTDFFAELREAKKHIHILFYIVKDDRISTDFLSILKEKAKEGVEVRLLLDWLGSLKVKKHIIRQLENNGVDFAFCKVPKPPFFFYSSQVRNHRKITVIDGKVGYLGGFNMGKEYINLEPKLSPWRDYHLKIQGEGVQDLQQVFLQDWHEAEQVDLTHNSIYFPPLLKGQYRHQLIPYEGFYLEETFSALIRNAEHSIMIGTPYFIPAKRVFLDLQSALKRGVILEILIPFTSDHALVKEASYKYLRKLLKLGATVYQYKKGFYHAKTLLIDDKVCDVGTANFDKRSFFLNHEMNCYTYDKQYIEHVRSIVQNDQKDATEVTLKDLRSLNPWIYCKEIISGAISMFL